jgi:hypothetical protein
MPSWEETKRAGQMAFTLASRGIGDVYSSIGNTYQQIMLTGHIYPMGGNDSLTHQITEDMYRQPEPEKEPLFYLNHFHGHEPEPDQGLEPER